MKECLNYQKLANKTLQCLVCGHFCRIRQGKTGICGIRQNLGGKLYLLTYGKAAAAHIDPVEKKPLFHFLPNSLSYSFGTVGCNFRCPNCQNYDISQLFRPKAGSEKQLQLEWGFKLPPQKIIENALENRCQSIAYTYTEPTVFLEYCLDTMRLAHRNGLKNIWVSNGFMSEQTLQLIVPYLDAINIDIKSFDDEFYREHCGGSLQPVLNNCKRLVKAKVWLEITTLIIPTLSDDPAMLKRLARFIKQELGSFVPWHLSAFSGAISWQLQRLPDTPIETIEKACALGRAAGLDYVYAGNIWQTDLESSYCPDCKKIAIQRTGYEVQDFTKKGNCQHCQKQLEGIFDK